MIKCPNCSAELQLDVKSQNIVCSYCGSTFKPAELREKIQLAKESKEIVEGKKEEVNTESIDLNNSYEGKSYTCSQCGATLLTFDETAITFCSYCGSQAIIESKMIRVNNPDYVIPFQKTKEECINNYKKKIRRSLFAPSYMKSDVIIQKFRGIYMPYVVYNLEYHNNFSVNGSKRSHRSGDYVYYNDYYIITRVDTDVKGISFDLLTKYYDKYSQMIPFDAREAKEFNVNYLSGFYADTKDVDNNTYDDSVKGVVRECFNNKLAKLKEYRKYNCENIRVPLIVTERKTGIFPVYFLSVKDKKNEHISYAIVNGQTGKVATDIPIDFLKYVLLTILISIGIFLLIDNYFLFLPKTILLIGLLTSFISLVISSRQLKVLNYKRQHLDDLGYVSQDKEKYREEIKLINDKGKKSISNKRYDLFKNIMTILLFFLISSIAIPLFMLLTDNTQDISSVIKNGVLPIMLFGGICLLFFGTGFLILKGLELIFSSMTGRKNKVTKRGKMPFSEMFAKYLYKQFLAIITCIVILMMNPVDDKYYYIGAIVCLLFVIISFRDILKEHNEITTNKLPQLEKRGGDEND